ncbi:hypothetical protein [Roseivivax sp. CAU 1761]
MAYATKQLDGASNGFDGTTVFVMTDGSIYRQTEYYYHYRYEWRPKATVINDREILLAGISKVVRVERLR